MDNIEKALAFLKGERLRGGTDTQAALDAALAQPYSNDPYLVVLSDLGSTRGILQNGKLAAWYGAKWKQLPGSRPPAHLRVRCRR